jgi:hypothetical protein
MHSFVAPLPHFEYQIDLCFFADLEDQTFKVGMICIDIFTKYAIVVPIKSKHEGDVAAGVLECMKKMFKKPKIIYTDDEAALRLPAIETYFDNNKIQHYITRHHAAFGERFIRTFENMLYKRIDNDNKADVYIIPQWLDYVEDIMITYIYKNKNSGMGMTPDDARRLTNQLEFKTNLELKVSRTIKYPTIEVDDKVRICFKQNLEQIKSINMFKRNI